MPNWVKNKIEIAGNPERIKELLAKADTSLSPFDFNGFVPMPDFVMKGNLSSEDMRKYPGDLNWYDWSCNHWGTKWNACDEISIMNEGTYAYVEFETAWDAPIPIYEAMKEQFPDLNILAEFADEDIGYNAGRWVNGKLTLIEDEWFSCEVWGQDYGEYLSVCEEYLKEQG